MKRLSPTIEVGNPTGDLSLHQKVTLDGRTIIDRPGDSILGPFVKALYRFICMPANLVNPGSKDKRVLGAFNNDASNLYSGLSVDTSSSPTILDASGTGEGNFNPTHDDFYDQSAHTTNGTSGIIWYLTALDSRLSGLYFTPSPGTEYPNTLEMYKITDFDKEWRAESWTPLDLTGETGVSIDQGHIWTIGPYTRSDFFNNMQGNSERMRDRLLQSPALRLGNNNNPNKINFPHLSNMGGWFSTSGDSNSAPANSNNQSTITYSRDFTNNFGQDIQVEEIVLTCRFVDRDATIPFARDINQFTIPDSSTVTVSYELTADNTGGGLMEHFMELLTRRHNNGREVSTINGTSVNRNSWYFDFSAIPILPASTWAFSEPPLAENIGPVVGTDPTSVNNGQESLVSKVAHGRESGELLHLDVEPSDIEIDEANDEMRFDIKRRFKNESGSDVVIEETGLYGQGGGLQNDYPGVESGTEAHMLARHTPNSVTVADGEILELTYQFTGSL